jgi:hypothetical protein
MLRLAALRLCDAGIIPIMLIHDGILFEETDPEKLDHAIEIMRGAGRDVCGGLEIGVDIDQRLEGGTRYRDKRPVAQEMWSTIMNTLQAIGALPRKRPSKRKPFVVEWVKFPEYWSERLERVRHLATYKLALRILREVYKRQQIGGEVVLSTAVTGLPRWVRWRAVRELVELGLISTTQRGNGAVIVTEIHHSKKASGNGRVPSV